MLEQAHCLLHFHAGAAGGNDTSAIAGAPSLNGLELGPRFVAVRDSELGGEQRKFYFDRVLTDRFDEEAVYGEALAEHKLVEAVLGGRSATVLALGLNATKTSNYKRATVFQRLLDHMAQALDEQEAASDWKMETRLSFACLGVSDSRCVNLLTEKTLSIDQVANGFTEAFFEPVSQLTEVVDRLHSGFSTPGYALAVRVERVPVRMMIAIDSDMDKNRNVFRSAAAVVAATNDTGAARPSVGLLVLANLGAVRLHDGEHAPNGLSSSANAIRHWVMAIVPPMGFAASPESATVPESSDYPLVTLLEPLIGGNTRLVMIMDVEERKPTCDLLNGLALGEAFRKLKTKQYLNSFDERVAVLWKMEEKYKLLRKFAEAMTEAEGIQQQTIDQLSMAIKKQQAKNAALVGEAELLRTQFCALEDEHKGKLHEMSTTIQETERDVDLLKQQLQSTEQELTKTQNETVASQKDAELQIALEREKLAQLEVEHQRQLAVSQERISGLVNELKQAKVGEGTANLDAENHSAFILRQSDSDRYQSDLKSTRDLLDTLKKTIHQLGQSQTELASQLGQTTNRSVAELDRSREQWEQDKKEMTTAIARLERDLSVKLSETSSVSKKVADLESDRQQLLNRVSLAESQLENNTRMVERAVMAKPATAPALPANDSVLAATLHPKKAITLVAKTKMEPAEEAKTMLNVAVTDVNPKTKRATKVKKPSITAESGSGTMIDESLSAGEESPVITQTAPTKSRSAPKKKRVIVGTEKDAVRAELVDATDKASKRKSTRAVKAVVYNVDAVDDDDTVSNVETSNKAVAHGMDKTHPLENDSPNKPAENERVLSLAQVKKKRRLLEDAPMSVASKSAEPLPLALPSLSTKSLPPPMKKLDAPSKTQGVINAAALQLIKAGFALPKLKK